MSRDYFFLQKASTGDGDDILIEHVDSFAFIESASMDGSKMIMALVDHAALYRDDYQIKKDTVITTVLADTNGSGDNVWIERFVVSKATSKDGILMVEGFEKSAHELKRQANKPQFFTDLQPSAILARLLPDLKVDSDTFERGATYHLNSGGTPSRLVRSMARDYGAACFISRGTVHFKSIKNLDMVSEFNLEHGNPIGADHSIAAYSIIGEESLYERVLNRCYVDWDIVTGMSSVGDGAKVMVSVPQRKALNNQCVSIIPIIDVELFGNTGFMPLVVCSVLLHKTLPAQEIDESLPEKQIISQVTHYQKGNRYQCRIELGVKNV